MVPRNMLTKQGVPCKNCMAGRRCPCFPHAGPDEAYERAGPPVIPPAFLQGLRQVQIEDVALSPLVVLGRERGRGGFGTVYEATYRGRRCAAKVVSDVSEANLQQNVEAFCQLKHPNVARFLGAARTADGRPCLLSELMHTSLAACLRRETGHSLSAATRLRLCTAAARGLAYLHSKRLLHMGVKADNVLLDSANCQGATKLCDVGVAQLAGADGLATAVASRRVWAYCAPEVLRDASAASPAADVHAFGLLIWEVFHSKVFWEEHPRLSTRQLASGWRPPVAAHVPPAVRGIMQRCWQQDPKDRPSMYVVVALLEIAADCCAVAAGAAASRGTARLLETTGRAQLQRVC